MTCRTCPALLTATDVRTGCIRCQACRQKHPQVYRKRGPTSAVAPKVTDVVPVTTESWWTQDLTWDEFSAKAASHKFSSAPGVNLRHLGFGDHAA